MRFKRLLALLLAAALALAVLVGCGSGQQSVASALLKLLDGRYPNISIEIDPDLEADLRQAISQAEAENAGDDAAAIRAALEKLVGSTVTFRNLGEGQQGDTTFDLVFFAGTDPDKAAQAAYSQWNAIFGTLPDDGQYGTGLAMVETDNGIWMLVKAAVEKAGTVDKPDKDDDEPETQEPPEQEKGYTETKDENGKITYTVNTEDGLQQLVEDLNWPAKNAILSANITLDCDVDLQDADWTPIGTAFGNAYKGTFNGGGHTIKGLTVTTSAQYAGLFGYINSGGTVKNVVLENVQITSDNSQGYVGGVVGYNREGTIENCSVSGSVTGSGAYSDAGGVVGYQIRGSITGCSSSATVEGMLRAGGVVGVTNGGALTGCYATGDVTIENDGTGNLFAGGVVGQNLYGGTVTACYHATGTVQGGKKNGGVVGSNDGSVNNCYWSGSPDGGIGTGNQAREYNVSSAYKIDNQGTTEGTEWKTTWQTAMAAMNKALSGENWQYVEGTGGNPPLTLTQN